MTSSMDSDWVTQEVPAFSLKPKRRYPRLANYYDKSTFIAQPLMASFLLFHPKTDSQPFLRNRALRSLSTYRIRRCGGYDEVMPRCYQQGNTIPLRRARFWRSIESKGAGSNEPAATAWASGSRAGSPAMPASPGPVGRTGSCTPRRAAYRPRPSGRRRPVRRSAGQARETPRART